MKCLKIRPSTESGYLVVHFNETGLRTLLEELEQDEVGNSWIVEISEMEEVAFNKLPEFQGW